MRGCLSTSWIPEFGDRFSHRPCRVRHWSIYTDSVGEGTVAGAPVEGLLGLIVISIRGGFIATLPMFERCC